MALTLQVINQPKDGVLENTQKVFEQMGGSIGRAEHCELQLPDESNQISKVHALVHFRDEQYFITDVSTNGVFVNSETIAIGKGNTKQLLQGERLRFGEYVLQVDLLGQAIQASKAETFAAFGGTDSAASIDDDIEALLANNDDISDLLDVEVNQLQTNQDSIFQDDNVNIDDLIAGLGQSNDNALDLGTNIKSDNEAAIADLLGESPADEVDVMSSFNAQSVGETLETVMALLDKYSAENEQEAEVVEKVRGVIKTHFDS
jgi:type VI secretion system FHA domain protein